MRSFKALAALMMASLLFLGPAAAQDGDGCSSFEWPMDNEMRLMRAPDAVSAKAGDALPAMPVVAVSLTLDPADAAKLIVTPSKRRSEDKVAFAGVITLPAPQKGAYQISLSGPGWIEVMQAGETLKAVAHTSSKNCKELRKSVRFDLTDAPFTVQVTGAEQPALRMTITPAKP